MPRGGARPGAGRKARAIKFVEAAIAEKIFRSMGGEAKAWEKLVRQGYGQKLEDGEQPVKLDRLIFVREILQYWTDRKYGKAVQRSEVAGEGGGALSVVVDL